MQLLASLLLLGGVSANCFKTTFIKMSLFLQPNSPLFQFTQLGLNFINNAKNVTFWKTDLKVPKHTDLIF